MRRGTEQSGERQRGNHRGRFLTHAAPQHQSAQSGHNRDGRDHRCSDRKCLGVSQRREQLVIATRQKEDRQETDNGCRHGGHDGRCDFDRGFVDDFRARLLESLLFAASLPIRKMLVNIL